MYPSVLDKLDKIIQNPSSVMIDLSNYMSLAFFIGYIYILYTHVQFIVY